MNFKIALTFEDGATRFVNCAPGQTVADAAFQSGVIIPLDCRDGACGTCKSFCESGAFAMSDYIDEALTAEEANAGHVLTCKMKPTSDCIVRIPASSEAGGARSAKIDTAHIAAIEKLSKTVLALSIEGGSIRNLDFLPGQYAKIFLPGSDDARAYSFSSLVKEGRVSFLIRNVPDGKMSRYLTHVARVGDELRYEATFGAFYLRNPERPILFIAGGTGLAPFLAMLDSAQESTFAQPIHLIYGVTCDEALVETETLQRLAGSLPDFSYDVRVVYPGGSGQKKGLVTDSLADALFNDGNVDIYLCGPPGMVSAVEAYIRARKLTYKNLYYEKFLASA